MHPSNLHLSHVGRAPHGAVRQAALLAAVAATFALALLLAAVATDAAAPASGAAARATAIRVSIPGGAGATAASVAAPPDAVSFGQSYVYPEDGTLVRAATISANASAAVTGETARASSGAEATGISLFNAEIVVQRVTAKLMASAQPDAVDPGRPETVVQGFTVAGAPLDLPPATPVALGDWGVATTAAAGQTRTDEGSRGFVTALEIRLTADHDGFPAGTVVSIGYAEASAEAAPATPTPTAAAPTTTRQPPKPRGPRDGEEAPSAASKIPSLVRRSAPEIEPRLTKRGFVFPVHAEASFGDSFGAARATTIWHHGADIFAPLGAPVLAVARGTLFSVGWNDVGGNRLWLRDDEGNEFYYAHLSAFSVNAAEGRRVSPGEVIGFVGNTGDAAGTPFHLHFEIHPLGLLGLGYDGVINPTAPLNAWRRVEDVLLPIGGRWFGSPAATAAPRPGAYLLGSADISGADGLRPGALRRAFEQPFTPPTPGTRPNTDR